MRLIYDWLLSVEVIILLRKYNLKLYLTATKRTEYTEGMLLRSLCSLYPLWQKVDIV